jgi:hypothetical protein
MESVVISHTIDILEMLYRRMPPLVPATVIASMAHAIEQVRLNPHTTLAEVEETTLTFGKQLWPYRKAFYEFTAQYEGEMGETYLEGRLSVAMKKRYREFLAYGGSFRELCIGRPALFFTAEERGLLCSILPLVLQDVRSFAMQAVMSTEKPRYRAHIQEFATILLDIERRLDSLRQMADEEQEHPELATEIRSQVRSFEAGLCLLEQETRYEAVCNAEEHFIGRKKEKAMRPRIHALT